jgi:uncharacterized membrane protein
MRLSRAILAFLVVCFIGQSLYYYPNLPEKMASHFNAFGEPDGWMSKSGFMIFEAVILFLIIAEFTLLPTLMEKMPASLINIPNKDYWLAEERRGQTFTIFRHYFEWFGIALLGLFIGINEFIFRANLGKQNLSNWTWIILLAFLLFVGIWVVKLMREFRIPK